MRNFVMAVAVLTLAARCCLANEESALAQLQGAAANALQGEVPMPAGTIEVGGPEGTCPGSACPKDAKAILHAWAGEALGEVKAMQARRTDYPPQTAFLEQTVWAMQKFAKAQGQGTISDILYGAGLRLADKKAFIWASQPVGEGIAALVGVVNMTRPCAAKTILHAWAGEALGEVKAMQARRTDYPPQTAFLEQTVWAMQKFAKAQGQGTISDILYGAGLRLADKKAFIWASQPVGEGIAALVGVVNSTL